MGYFLDPFGINPGVIFGSVRDQFWDHLLVRVGIHFGITFRIRLGSIPGSLLGPFWNRFGIALEHVFNTFGVFFRGRRHGRSP